MKRYLFVLVTFSLTLLLYIDRVCIAVAKEPISNGMGFSDTQMGWVLSAFALGYALFQTPAGMLADYFGPRKIITIIVSLWSLFTALTGAVWNFISMLVVRFLFGAGEAGAFPGISRAVFNWIPLKERGIVTGINFSGSRLGAAFALPLVALLIDLTGWRTSFFILGVTGIFWALIWYFWFRDDPLDHEGVSETEKKYIAETRQKSDRSKENKKSVSLKSLFTSKNMWMAMFQYFGSNFIFFFCLTWMFPYLQDRFGLSSVKTGFFAMIPLLAGAVGNWVSGLLVDAVYKKGYWKLSRSIPAITGFILVIGGIVGILLAQQILPAVLFLALAIFGADMTLSPSWSFCVDIGRQNAGAVSGTMNMAGNIGSFVTGLAFPYLAMWTGSNVTFFVIAGVLALLSAFTWMFMKPEKPLEEY